MLKLQYDCLHVIARPNLSHNSLLCTYYKTGTPCLRLVCNYPLLEIFTNHTKSFVVLKLWRIKMFKSVAIQVLKKVKILTMIFSSLDCYIVMGNCARIMWQVLYNNHAKSFSKFWMNLVPILGWGAEERTRFGQIAQSHLKYKCFNLVQSSLRQNALANHHYVHN